uniref:Uncharacterized protein n=1 Tax=Glossina pallidipes TaxID=7398 RepID=A0A1B0AC82_GLOPL
MLCYVVNIQPQQNEQMTQILVYHRNTSGISAHSSVAGNVSECRLNSRKGGARDDVQTNERKEKRMAQLVQILGFARIHIFCLELVMLLIEITSETCSSQVYGSVKADEGFNLSYCTNNTNGKNVTKNLKQKGWHQTTLNTSLTFTSYA